MQRLTKSLTEPNLHYISATLYELHAQKMDAPKTNKNITYINVLHNIS